MTVFDPATGETAHADVQPGSYALICHEPCHRVGIDASADGTHVITIAGVRRPMAGLIAAADLERTT
ncbi:hypothetical protein C1J01_09000 [Nonomuraea aridisoli]|uniref:Uncharacterized protein n=1 Tax=Nonomuraea aridisoli TaxID=2070368 RepID=A0A2W2EV02_9ACTN|nr:hypothetical protein C1J01_09000 [Nonomuraea aridisoli]